jgi:beta-galactosidase GanA
LLYSRASLIQRFPSAQGNKTPYTIEIEKTYAATAELDAPVGFVSSQQVVEGIPPGLKLIFIPGVRFMEEDVLKILTDWVRAGGTLVITPTSLVADQYNRKRDYLAALDLNVMAEELPEFMAGEARRGIDQSGEFNFIQGPVSKTIVTKEPKRKIRCDIGNAQMMLDAAGVIQTVAPADDWKVLGKYAEDNAPGVLVKTLGKGKIWYLCADFTVASRRWLFDQAFTGAEIYRPVRAWAKDGGLADGIESRTVEKDGNWLTYVTNTSEKAVEVQLKPNAGLGKAFNLVTEKPVDSASFVLKPLETCILQIERNKP